ncbi:MAG: hypothetical protein K5Q68_19655, partial [Roseococcus sp.]|nr:hypothetical protein [Roseococcus sp.]
QLGVSVGQLRTMGSEGQLTSDRVFQALLRASEAINKQFIELTPTMGRAFGVLGQAMVEFVGKLDQALGLSQAIARAATTAAAAVGRVSGGIGPRSPAEQAEFDVVQAQARVARLEAELASLSGEPGLYAAPRRGTISRGLQETAAQTQPREERLAELRQRIEAENAIIREGLARRNQAHTEADEIRQAEEATAAARRAAAARTTQTTAFNAARDALDQERKLRTDHATRITAIDAGLANGDTDAAGAARLRRMANEELADGLKALDAAARGRIETDESLAEVMRAVADIEKDRQALMREGETVTASVRTEAEKYAEQLAHLNNLLGAGAISQETYNRAVAAADPAIKAAEEASKRIEQENTRTTDRITSFFGDAFARAFEGTGNGFRGLMDSFRRAAISTFASIAAQAVIRPIVAPIVQGLGLSQLGIGGGGSLNLSGLFGSGAAQAATPAGGSGGGGLGSAGSFSTLRTAYDGLTSPGGLGSFFPGGAAVNTGWGGLDGLLNTSLYTPAAAGSLTSSGFYAGTSMAGEAGAFVGGGGAAQSLTLAGSIGPLAAIGGGAYGVYSGIQRGGIGGYTSAAGGAISAATGIGMLGAAAGLLPALGVLGPIGLGVGALLAIGGSLLPGQRASGQGQLARQNLNSSEMSYEGLGGRRFSQRNRDAATGSVQNIAQLAREIGDSLGGARIGGNVAVGVTNRTLYLDVNGRKSQFANNEDGAKQLSEAAARMVIQEFKSQQVVQNDDYRSILNRSDDSLESLGGNLQWYEKIYKALTQSSSAASAYAKAIEEATKPYNDAIGRARSLGLAEAELVRKRDEAWTRITRARDIETSNLSVGIVSRGIAADAWGGDQGSMKYWQDMQAAANAAETEVTALRLKLEQLGASSEFAATMIAQLETVQRAESAARERAR